MKINYQRLSTDTLAELVKRVLGISKKEAYVMVLNHPLLVKLMAVADEYLIVFDKRTFSGKGELVAKADLLRDNLFKGLKDCVFGLSQMPGLSTQQTAIDLSKIFEAHGIDLYHYSYGDESSHLDKLIEELEMPANKAKIALVHLTEGYDLLKASQMNFNLNFSDQTTANAELRRMKSASSLQESMINALRDYLHYVDVMSGFDPSWNTLETELNEAVKAANNSKAPKKQATLPIPMN